MSIDIDTLLKEKKQSKTDIAKKMGLSRESLYRILSGNPTLDNIVKLANALGESVSEETNFPAMLNTRELFIGSVLSRTWKNCLN